MQVHGIRTPGLGDTTYILEHRGVGVLVDPQRDVDRFLALAEADRIRLQYVLETHLHNDYVSGGREAARRAGARLVLPAAAGAAFDHIAAFHLEDLPADAGLTIRPIHTPGHTPEHVSFLVLVDGEPVALFSGGSLLVGSAGRTDLLGPERAFQLAIRQYESIQRLIGLPEHVGLYPTHGAGSFCTATTAGRDESRIGIEKRENAAVSAPDAETFARAQLAGLQPYPRYYAQMGPINVLGPAPIPRRTVPILEPSDLAQLAGAATVVDARPRGEFAAGHVPGALGIELDDQFGVWVGWLLPFNAPIALVMDEGQDAEDAVVQLARIGFDEVRGIMRGVEAWRAAGYPLESFEAVDLQTFAQAIDEGRASQVLDVRSPAEWDEGHLAGSVHRYVPDLVTTVPGEFSRDRPVWVACAAGYRATIAASLLQRSGYRPIVLTGAGVPDLLRLQSARSAA